jgi:glycine/D-amino acid oxidase-like deaminating enzyme
MKTEVAVIGAGTEGCAAALAAAEAGRKVVMTCPHDWVGGQLTAQAVPPDKHWAIERYGSTRSYRNFRNKIREYYRRNYPLLPKFRDDPYFNPGGGRVSRLCFEPRIGLAVLNELFARYISCGTIKILHYHTPVGCERASGKIRRVYLRDARTEKHCELEADYFLDATELGDLLPLSGEDYVTGAESQKDTGEPHALAGDSNPEDVQGFTWCMLMSLDHNQHPDTDIYRVECPAQYQKWKNYIPELDPPWTGPLFFRSGHSS